jgi:hypothetical protein
MRSACELETIFEAEHHIKGFGYDREELAKL